MLYASFDADCYNESFIEKIVLLPTYEGDVTLGKDVMEDVEMFRAYKTDDDNTIFDGVFDCHLKGTPLYTSHVLAHPTTDTRVLRRRQEISKALGDHADDINAVLETMKPIENDVLWLFQNKEENVNALYDIVYFRFWFLKSLNGNDHALTARNLYRIFASPVIGIVSPIIYFVLPYLVLRYRFKFPLGFVAYLKILFESAKFMLDTRGVAGKLRFCSYLFSLVFYFQGVFNELELSKTMYNIADFIVGKTQNILTFLSTATDLTDRYYGPAGVGDMDEVYFGCRVRDANEIKEHSYPDVCRTKLWMLTNFGKYLKTFKHLDKAYVSTVMTRIYMMDSVVSIANAKEAHRLAYTEYERDHDDTKSKTPLLKATNLRHPCLNCEAVGNDVCLGTDGQTRNMILTGPNAGGKSTFVRSLLINVLFSQTIGLSVADSCKMTPFKYINSQINIPDCKGKESLFQAEMNRCKNNIDRIKALNDDEFALVLMDEVFNSTNPVEGISGAYAVAAHMAKHARVMVVFTTHFAYLTKLAKKTGAFCNYKMNVIEGADGAYVFPYKLKKGISKQYIALELLERNGFDSELIDEAKRVRDDICV